MGPEALTSAVPQAKSLRSSRSDTPTTTTITLTGQVAAADVGRLRSEFIDALHDGRRDLLVDMHQVTAFADNASAALVGGRAEAKFRRRRLVVLDAEDGAAAASLRRTGLIFNIPVYADQRAADEAIEAVRAALRHRLRGFGRPAPRGADAAREGLAT
jgi:hypothetical protein